MNRFKQSEKFMIPPTKDGSLTLTFAFLLLILTIFRRPSIFCKHNSKNLNLFKFLSNKWTFSPMEPYFWTLKPKIIKSCNKFIKKSWKFYLIVKRTVNFIHIWQLVNLTNKTWGKSINNCKEIGNNGGWKFKDYTWFVEERTLLFRQQCLSNF